MKKTLLSLALCLFAGATFAAEMSGTYKVGGEGADYASLLAACEALDAATLTGDVTLAICANLTEPDNIGIINTSEFTIAIRPDKAEKRTITFTHASDDNSGPSGSIILGIKNDKDANGKRLPWASLTPSKNFVIDGAVEGAEGSFLEIALANTGGGCIVALGDVQNVEIKNLSIINTRTSNTAYCINIRERNNLAPNNVLIENCHLETKTSSGTCTAVNFQVSTSGGTVYSKNVTIRGCELIGSNRGIFLQGGENVLIEDNIIRVPGKAGALANGIMGYGTRGDVIIRGNKFVELTTAAITAGHGIEGIQIAGGGDNWIIENNYFAGLDVLGDQVSGTDVYATYVWANATVTKTTIRHNTFYIPSLTKKPVAPLLSGKPTTCFYAAAGTQHVVQNNIFVSAETEAYNSLYRGAPTAETKNNVFYHAGGNASIVAGSVSAQDWTAYEASAYKTANPAAWVDDIAFADAANGDLSLASANEDLLVDAIAEVTTDIEGTTRGAEKVYAGAFEYVSGETTAIENAEVEQVNVRKVIENGQIIIIRDGVRYNVMGMRIE